MKKPVPFGKYYLLDRISVGGMAEVFKAKAFGVEGFERLLAVKRILPSIAEDEEFITMFIDEAKIAVQLNHANIARIDDLGKVGDSYFIAMEYVEGKDLRAIFDRMRKKAQTVPFSMAVYITMKMCEGLDYAHNKKDSAGRDLNLVHRDVSPQNVLISFDGQVKLIDFGIAKAAGKAGKTQAGILKGKFGYMSPEQVRGLSLDRRSDIFAVGICLWELLTGERLFIGESDFSTLEKVRNVDIVAPSSFNKRIPVELEKIVLKALSKEVEERYQSAMDLHDDLQSYMYTSGSFFSRKDLLSFMQEVFREDIEKNAAAAEEFDDSVLRSSVPPPPRASKTGSGKAVPVPPGKVSSPTVPRPSPGGVTVPPAPPRPAGSGMPAPPSPSPSGGAIGVRTAPQAGVASHDVKKTMLGMPAVAAPPPPRPTGSPSSASSTSESSSPILSTPLGTGPGITPPPPKPSGGASSLPLPPGPSLPSFSSPPQGGLDLGMASSQSNDNMDMDWDDDEEPTNIYTKDTAVQMAAVATRTLSAGPPPSLAQTGPRPSLAAPTRINEPVSYSPSRKRKNKTKSLIIGVAVGVIVAVAAVVGIFKFGLSNTGQIELNITPGDELSVVVDGSRKIPQNVSPMLIEDLSIGQHSFIINREGYAEKELIFDVRPKKRFTTEVTLEKAGGSGLYVESDPPGCTVEIDGKVISGDTTPMTISDLEPGTHEVKISKDKYSELKFEVDIEKGKTARLPLKKLVLAQVEVTFNTKPQGNRVALLDAGKKINLGVTPATHEIETGREYEVEYSCGARSVVRPLSKSDIETGESKISLPAVPCEAASAVVKRTPTSSAQPVHKPASSGGGASHPAAASNDNDSGGGDGADGYLSVQTQPWSKVFINGTFVKNTPLVKKALKPGKYKVTVQNEGFGIDKSFNVTIKSGKTTTLVKKLI
ncbi:MAG: protein kinase [Deltaproteobacteria bacterium]|nr:protein kinase [Deltaproteobacteria bacterium]